MTGQVIPSRVWKSRATGRTFSVYSSYRASDCELVEDGYTVLWPDGTEGTGTKHLKTRAEAQAFADRNPHFRGYNND